MNILEKITDESHRKIYLKYASIPPPFDVVGFGLELGLEIKESGELPNKISGFIKQIENGKISICVNKSHAPNRKRFTVAHELGHYFLHRDRLAVGIIDGILNREQGTTDPIEYEANDFGANLLMPEELFTQLWKQKDSSISDMALIFQVSESAIITRAKFLNLAQDYSGYFA